MPSISPATRSRRLLAATIGALLLIVGTAQLLLAHVIAQSAWTSPSYSWWSNYISDLGATRCGPVLQNVVCSPLHAVMNAGFIAQGVLLLLAMALLVRSRLAGARPRAWQIMMAITGVSWILVGVMPEDVTLTGHSIGALPIFILGNIALLTAGLSRPGNLTPAARRSAFVLGIAGLLGFVLTALAMAMPAGLIGIGAAERLTVFPLQIWAVIGGVSILRTPILPAEAA